MAEMLPLFPLNLVVFPGEQLRLYIFEARYRQLINECLESGSTFGIPTVVDKQVKDIGTEVQVLSLDNRFPEGEMNITAVGIGRIRIDTYYPVVPDKLYPGGQVDRLVTDEENQPELQVEIYALLKQFNEVLGLSDEMLAGPEKVQSFNIGHHLGMNLEQEYKLLTLADEYSRLHFIKEHLEQVLPVVMETERLKSKVRLNGHYKSLLPPEIEGGLEFGF